MDEFISREATIKRIKEVYCAGCNSYNGVRCRACGTGDAIDIIEDAPAADVAPVVRCTDCKYHDDYGVHFCNRLGMDCPDDSDFSCSYGKPKNGDDSDAKSM